MRTVVGVFPSRVEANGVARDLEAMGIPNEEVLIVDGTDARAEKEGEWTRRNISAAAASGFGWFLAGLVPLIAERTYAAAARVGALIGGGAGTLIALMAVALRSGTPMGATTAIITVLGALCSIPSIHDEWLHRLPRSLQSWGRYARERRVADSSRGSTVWAFRMRGFLSARRLFASTEW